MTYIPGRSRKYIRDEAENRLTVKGDIDVDKLKIAYGDLEKAFRELKESQIEVILNLAIVAEYKDADTGNHILRISDYATEIAMAIELEDADIEILRYASPMHDIGKIGIPDHILQKPGKLTPEEFEIMKRHAIIGAKMFEYSRSPLLQAASKIAYTHHEKYDGTGYPNGLKGEDIPIFGRIVAMADVFDALVTKRCYKEAVPFEKGAEIILSLGGTHLDPNLVEVFRKNMPTIRKIYDANATISQFVEEARSLSPGLLSLE